MGVRQGRGERRGLPGRRELLARGVDGAPEGLGVVGVAVALSAVVGDFVAVFHGVWWPRLNAVTALAILGAMTDQDFELDEIADSADESERNGQAPRNVDVLQQIASGLEQGDELILERLTNIERED